jgi:AraC-like DNA-binding protein
MIILLTIGEHLGNIENTPMVKGGLLDGVAEILTEFSYDAEAFYRQFYLKATIESETNKLISFELFVEIIEKLITLTSIKHPVLKMAQIQAQPKKSFYFDLILSAPNIEVALQIARRFRHTYSEVTYWDWSIEEKFVVIQRRSFVPLRINDREHCLYSTAVVYLLLKSVMGLQSQFKRISLVQPKEKQAHELEQFFNCPISYSQDFDGFILTIDAFYKPNKNFNPKRYETLLKKLLNHPVVFPKNQQFSTSVKSLILQTLSTEFCTLIAIANIMKMHPRAIQKALAKEKLTFKLLVNEVRMNIAKRLLIQKDVHLIQISLMLGYSEASAFSRAFHANENCCPRVWRNNNI